MKGFMTTCVAALCATSGLAVVAGCDRYKIGQIVGLDSMRQTRGHADDTNAATDRLQGSCLRIG